jgi:hypothetical protein
MSFHVSSADSHELYSESHESEEKALDDLKSLSNLVKGKGVFWFKSDNVNNQNGE